MAIIEHGGQRPQRVIFERWRPAATDRASPAPSAPGSCGPGGKSPRLVARRKKIVSSTFAWHWSLFISVWVTASWISSVHCPLHLNK